VKPTAFLWADGKSIVIHVVNASDEGKSILLAVNGIAWRSIPAARQRTSATENMATLSPIAAEANGIADTLPARSLTTYRMTRK
jgi:O-glycosyl hydrolase